MWQEAGKVNPLNCRLIPRRTKPKARRKPLSLEEQASERKVDSLVLHRTRVLVYIAKARDERYRKTLEEGLAYLEAQLKELGWKPE